MKKLPLILVLLFFYSICLAQEEILFEQSEPKRFPSTAQAIPLLDPNERFPEDPAVRKIATGRLDNLRAYGGWRNGVYGVVIKTDVHTDYMMDKNVEVVCWFYFWNGNAHTSQQKLKDFNKRYRTTNGQVSTSNDYVPSYKSNKRSDLELFLPFDELHLSKGKHEVCFDCGILFMGKQVSVLDYYKILVARSW